MGKTETITYIVGASHTVTNNWWDNSSWVGYLQLGIGDNKRLYNEGGIMHVYLG